MSGPCPSSVNKPTRSRRKARCHRFHAYTFKWTGQLDTRTKDLVDFVLLIERGLPDVAGIQKALQATFSTRTTHPLPATLNPPPVS